MLLPYWITSDDPDLQAVPWLVYSLLAALVLAFTYTHLVLPEPERLDAYYRFGATGYRFLPYMPLTCVFLHAGYLHLIGNCYFLFIYGSVLERQLTWWRFLVIFGVGAVLSVLVHRWTLAAWDIDQPTIGASGAISALLGAVLVLMPKAQVETLFFNPLTFRPFRVRIPAWLILALWFLGQLIHTLRLLGDMGPVAFWAHIAGFVAGAAMGTLFHLQRDRLLAAYATRRRTQLASAWQAFLAGDLDAADAGLAALSDGPPLAAQGGQALLTALLARRHGAPPATVRPHLLQAFRQATDYRDPTRQLTIYLHLLRHDSPFEIPGDVHRDAGYAAVALHQPALALRAFHYTLVSGDDTRLPQLLNTLAGLLEHKLQRPDLARQLRALRD
jgi:membrane associated rhomboid family serine protease